MKLMNTFVEDKHFIIEAISEYDEEIIKHTIKVNLNHTSLETIFDLDDKYFVMPSNNAPYKVDGIITATPLLIPNKFISDAFISCMKELARHFMLPLGVNLEDHPGYLLVVMHWNNIILTEDIVLALSQNVLAAIKTSEDEDITPIEEESEDEPEEADLDETADILDYEEDDELLEYMKEHKINNQSEDEDENNPFPSAYEVGEEETND